MPRRTHKKSRNGCLQCKKRHIKCDENKPYCVNCVTVGNRCSFEREAPAKRPSDQPVSSQSTEQNKTNGSAASTVNDSHAPRPLPAFDPNLNLEHLDLFHHWMTETYLTFADENDLQQEIWRVIIIREGLIYPFLMHEILAVSALHLANVTPSRREHYYHRATELQSVAMAGFNALGGRIDEKSCVAVLIFSILIGLHVLADRSRTEHLDNTGFIDHFLHCIRLIRGVRILVVDDLWDTIKERPELSPLVHVHPVQKPFDIPKQVKQLRCLLSNPEKLGEEAVIVYGRAIDSLEWIYAVSGVPKKTYRTVRWIMAWAVRSSPEYLDLVAERRPEALIILAYYAAVLHFQGQSWVVGDTGRLLIRAINANLGEHWRHWMQWPNDIVGFVECSGVDNGLKKSAMEAVLNPGFEVPV